MHICEHLGIDEDDELASGYTYTYPDGHSEMLCDDCAETDFCIYCYKYIGDEDRSTMCEYCEQEWLNS